MAQFRSGNMSAFEDDKKQVNHNMTYQYEGSGPSLMMNNNAYQQQPLVFAGNAEQDSMYVPGYQN